MRRWARGFVAFAGNEDWKTRAHPQCTEPEPFPRAVVDEDGRVP
jgi:hypothetical protein